MHHLHHHTILATLLATAFRLAAGDVELPPDDTIVFGEHKLYRYAPPGHDPKTPVLAFVWIPPLDTSHRKNAAKIYPRLIRANLTAMLYLPVFADHEQTTQRPEATGTGKALLAMIEAQRAEIALEPRFVISGFSKGAQFAHRFAYAWPDQVCAVYAHAPGSWSPPPRNPLLQQIPFYVTCYRADVTRIGPAIRQAGLYRDAGYVVRGAFGDGGEHGTWNTGFDLAIDWIASYHAGRSGRFLELTAPVAGPTLPPGSRIQATWTSSGLPPGTTIAIDASADDKTWRTLIAATPDDGAEEIVLPAEPGLWALRIHPTGALHPLDRSDETLPIGVPPQSAAGQD